MTRVAAMTWAFVVAAAGMAHGQPPALETARTGAVEAFVDPVAGLSLADAIARALAHAPAMTAARRQVDIAQGERVQAGLRANPMVTIEQRVEPAGTDAATMLAVEWPLELFRRSARTAVASAQVAAVTLGVADRERQLAGEVRARYGDVVAAVRELDLLERLSDSTARQRDVLAARVEEGASTPLDRDLVDIEARRLEAERLLQLGRVEAAVSSLRQVLGLAVDAPLRVRDRLEDVATTVPPGAADAAAGPGRPDVREADARLAVADAALEQARADGRVDLALLGGYTRMDAGFPQLGFAPSGGGVERIRGQFHYASAGVRLTLPILDRGQGARAIAQGERAKAEATRDATRLAAAHEVAAARQRHARALAAVQGYRDLVALSRRSLSTVQQTYELGRATLLDLLAEQRRHLDAERAYSGAMQAAYEAATALQLATGAVR